MGRRNRLPVQLLAVGLGLVITTGTAPTRISAPSADAGPSATPVVPVTPMPVEPTGIDLVDWEYVQAELDRIAAEQEAERARLEAEEQARLQAEYDRDCIAVTIFNEAWDRTTLEHKEAVGQVILNRVKSDEYPDNVHDVICQRAQYRPAYCDMDSVYARNAMKYPEVWTECQRIAQACLDGTVEHPIPDNVLFQANFTQGDGIYKTFETPYSISYFCYLEQ